MTADLAERYRVVGKWTPVQKARLIVALTLPFNILLVLICGALLGWPEMAPHLDPTMVRITFLTIAAALGTAIVLYGIGSVLIRRGLEDGLFVVIALQCYGIQAAAICFCMGLFSGYTWMVLTASATIGIALFGWRRTLVAVASAVCLLVTAGFGAWRGWLIYGPLMEIPRLADGRPAGGVMLAVSLVLAFVAVLSSLMIGYFLTVSQEREGMLEVLSETDGLTSLANRRALMERLQVELERAQRYGRSLSFALLDIDHFKQVNDIYGHLEGDRVLVSVAEILCRTVRSHDLVCRYGGEEFALVLPETDLSWAVMVVERCRAQIAALEIDFENGATLSLTVSGGVVAAPQESDASAEELIRRADEALYKSKAAGRNQVRTAHVTT